VSSLAILAAWFFRYQKKAGTQKTGVKKIQPTQSAVEKCIYFISEWS